MATLLCLPLPVNAQASVPGVETLDLTQAPIGLATIAIFVLACQLVMMEEFLSCANQGRYSWPPVLSGFDRLSSRA
jgi:hypothetical protein